MGLLVPFQSKVFTQRSGVLAAVAGLHLVALVIAVNARTRVEEPVPATLIHVSFLHDEAAPQEALPELPPPKLEQPPPPDIDVPLVLIPVIDVPDSRAIVAAPPPPPPPVTTQVPRSDDPVMLNLEEVEVVRAAKTSYPRAAKAAGLQGVVQVWVEIDPEGRPRQVRVHRSSGYEQLDRAGCDAVMHALFTPYRRNGEPRSARVIYPVEFRLTPRTAQRN